MSEADPNSDREYKYEVPDGHFDDSSGDDGDASTVDETDDTAPPTATTESQCVDVTLARRDERDLKYRVYVTHGAADFLPVASHARRDHRIAESSQWDPDGEVDWADLPSEVQEQVASVVADVTDPGDLDAGVRIIDDSSEGSDA